ncbi:hypothetical protein BGY98DRAFT_935145 [Russula aff. rugulosa BPL654]|nr:hypothetical protein BGY98DRAFT_935145 [Russula aff. rugulosa BPL654]
MFWGQRCRTLCTFPDLSRAFYGPDGASHRTATHARAWVGHSLGSDRHSRAHHRVLSRQPPSARGHYRIRRRQCSTQRKRQILLVQSIEWTAVVEADTYDTALEQANVIPRYLLSIGTHEECAAEYLDYRQFLIAWETLERVTECQSLEAPQRPEYARSMVQGLRVPETDVPAKQRLAADRRGNWLVSDKIFIPELILRLHGPLVSSRSLLPMKLSLTHLTAGADPGTVAQGREAQRLLPSTPKASMLPPATPSHSSSTPRTMPYHNTTNIRRAVPSHVLFTVTERGVGRVGGHGHTRH